MYLIIIGLMLCIAAVSYGQSITEPAVAPPFSYDIKLLALNREKKRLTIRIQLRNLSREEVLIDKNALNYRTLFTRLGRPTKDGGMSAGVAQVVTAHGFPGEEYRGDVVALKPNEVYRATSTLGIGDDFFKNGHSFLLSVTYGHFRDSEFNGCRIWRGSVESNEIRFRL